MAKYLIVGGVAGGATAAARLRRLDEKAEIIIFERGAYISYANCGLPYYIGGTIADRERLFVQTPESFGQRLNVDVRVKQEVISIQRDKKTITVKNLTDGSTYEEAYDKLVLSPGAEPIRPNLPGIQDEAIFTLRNVPDTDRVKQFIEKNKPRRAVIVGAGFIGLEMAENLHKLGIFVTIVEMSDQVMTPLDYEMAAEVHQHLKTKKVEFYLKDGISSFQRQNGKLICCLQSGRCLETDMAILSIGVKPESKLASDAGLAVSKQNGILVNEYLQTSDTDVYAVGDAISFPHPILKEPTITYLAGPANRQARFVADNIVAGNSRAYHGSISTAIAKVFDITVASTGVSEKVLRKAGIPYIASIVHGASHAGYYPDALPMTLKILFSPEKGVLYGAQLVGFDGVDKRADLLATVVQRGGTIYDLQEIEHSYAPPFSSAKDPVNIAGYAAENILRGFIKIKHWFDVVNFNPQKDILLDVRTADEFKLGTIEGAVNIPIDELRNRLSELDSSKEMLVFCGVGQRGYLAARILEQNGFQHVYNLSGGYKTWEHAIQKQGNEDIFANDIIGKDDHIYQSAPAEKIYVPAKTIAVDACGLQCPGPIMRLRKEMDNLQEGDEISITATDPGFLKDVPAWCQMTQNKLISINEERGKITAVIRKGGGDNAVTMLERGQNKTLVVFSDDLDRALASLVIANGAASTGKKVTMFFTFWGLNVIKKVQKPKVKKDFMGKMFSLMLPGSSKGLGLSKINMLGMGAKMMRMRMKAKQVDSLESMLQQAVDSGIQLIACQMSMDVMGVDKEELIEGVTVGGVATYLQETEQASLNLFI